MVNVHFYGNRKDGYGIEKKSIRSLNPYKNLFEKKPKLIVGIPLDLTKNKELLRKIGFSSLLEEGEVVLPNYIFGTKSLFNAEGKYKIHKDQPLETAYRVAEWHWEEFNGPYDTISRSKLVDIPYKRYPRTFIEPPSIELKLVKDSDGNCMIISPEIPVKEEGLVINSINLFLEIFGECQFFTEDLEPLSKIPVRRLNWKILPRGKRPWEQLKKEVGNLIKEAPKGNQVVIEHRLETINNFDPEFAAIGEAGFRGYIILGFPQKKVFMLESLYYGNATYIFDKNWEELSRLSKAEILNNNLQQDRVIHRVNWDSRINILLN